jgi:creatinine amidohydrolase
MPSRLLSHLSSPDIAALDKQTGVVILPVGAIEQHGAHLPVATDALLAEGVLTAAFERLPETVAAWRLPALSYGKSAEHARFAGTMSLRAETLQMLLHDIAAGVASAGFRRLAFFNGHGGNVAVLDSTARDVRQEFGLLTFCLHPNLYIEAPFEQSAREKKWGIHAGEIETSLMLALHPDQVDMTRAIAHFPDFPSFPDAPQLHMFGPASAAWLTEDWSPAGVFGDATIASAEKGRAVLAAAATRLAGLIAAISVFDVAGAARA